jgi:hypothetical protein
LALTGKTAKMEIYTKKEENYYEKEEKERKKDIM